MSKKYAVVVELGAYENINIPEEVLLPNILSDWGLEQHFFVATERNKFYFSGEIEVPDSMGTVEKHDELEESLGDELFYWDQIILKEDFFLTTKWRALDDWDQIIESEF